MDGQAIKSVAMLLRQTREHHGISVRDAAEALNIPVHYLQALEGGDRLPTDPTYLIPFLRAYVTYLGLDPNTVVRQFMIELQKSEAVRVKKPPDSPLSPARFSAWIIPLMLFVGSLVGLSFFIRSADLRAWWPLWQPQDTAPVPLAELPDNVQQGVVREPVEAEPQEPAVEPATTHSEDTQTASLSIEQEDEGQPPESAPGPSLPPTDALPSRPQDSQISQVSPGVHQLHIEALEKTWLRVVIDKDLPQEVLLQPNEQVRWEAKKNFTLTVGNAGGVELTFDGTRLPPLGRSGEVVRQLRLPALEAR